MGVQPASRHVVRRINGADAMKGIAIYCRVSTEEQGEKNGLEVQAKRCLRWIDAYADDLESRGIDWNKVTVYSDMCTGRNQDRVDLANLLSAVRSQRIGLVLVMSVDRLARSCKDALVFLDEQIAPHGCALASVTQQFDTTTLTGRLVFQMLCAIAEYDIGVHRDRMHSGQVHHATQKGLHWGGDAPYGYALTATPGVLAINEKEAQVVRHIFAMRQLGVSVPGMILSLAEHGLPPRDGGSQWCETTVRKILKRRAFYEGRAMSGKVQLAPGATAQHPAILTQGAKP